MILVTGGSGYIGSHTSISLIEAGYDIVIFDNFSNSSKECINRIEKIVNKKVIFQKGDIRNKKDLQKIFDKYKISSVIHFAGLKAVGESTKKPLDYYDNNLYGTITLCKVMKKNNCKQIIFSSSATVYGNPHTNPIKENFPLKATNPYGRTKLFIEEMLHDLYLSDKNWKIIILRYFNPTGAHKSGLIGEDPKGIPNNLIPFISQTAIKKLKFLTVFGNNYNTHDGTGVRDYIHVMDLADGHIKALKKISELNNILTINLGTGKGYSVLDVVKAFEKASNTKIPIKIAPVRTGDIAQCYTDPTYANEVLDWKAQKDINEMCEDTWRWQQQNPNGYKSEQ